jgi:leader peptidase (prepilin peptidase)/N-methyltransferase
MTSGIRGGGLFAGQTRWALPVAIALAGATLARLGLSANGAAWAAAQVLIVVLAATDIATRRLPNLITIPGALTAVGLRVAFARSELAEVVVAGVASLLGFGVLSLVVRGGLGMGNVKLAGMLGFLLGSAVVPALLIGTLLGGAVSLTLVAGSRATLRTHIAYGPYLASGAAVAILGFNLPLIV